MHLSDRKPGISMLLRLKNEEEWIEPCIKSIEWADEIVCCLQNSTDRTEEILKDLGITPYYYNRDSRPNGPGHNNQPYDVYNRAYFYNWSLSKTTKKHVVKWDGDMVAMDWLQEELILPYDLIKFHGVDIITDEDGRYYVRPERKYCAAEFRFFKVNNDKHWKTGVYCEQFVYEGARSAHCIREPAFLHFKWSKNKESATTAWPSNWRDVHHFRELIKRGSLTGAEPYEGEIPSVI